ncbi:hypothetical protein BC2926_42330 [Bacillus cereus]|nr:hypothetical protein BC2926_42330 [Bacillus cereus]
MFDDTKTVTPYFNPIALDIIFICIFLDNCPCVFGWLLKIHSKAYDVAGLEDGNKRKDPKIVPRKLHNVFKKNRIR